MTRTFSALVVSSALALCLVGAARAQPAREPLATLDAFVDRTLADWEIPGLSLAVVKDDRVVIAKGYGRRELGRDARVDADTLFGIGSCSKAFAAASLGVLVSDGKVAWEDRATTYLPWLEVYDPWVTHELRLRDLVSHRVGTDYNVENRLRPVSSDQKDLLRRSKSVQPVAPFREQFVYSNNMFIATGQLVAAVAGKPWPEFAKERLWGPLGMTATNASATTSRQAQDHATPHMVVDEKLRPVEWEYPDRVAVPSGGLNSNAHDMAEWLRFQLGQGTHAGRSIIRADVVKEMHTAQSVVLRPREGVPRVVSQPELGGRFFGYGMGWFVNDYRGRKMLWHSGSIDGFRCAAAMLPEEQLGVVALINAERTQLAFAVAFRVLDAYLGASSPDWSAKLLAETREGEASERERERQLVASRPRGATPLLPLDAYVGTYADDAFGRAVVSREGGALTLKVGALAGPLEHWRGDTFRARLNWDTHPFGQPFVAFVVDPKAQVVAVEIDEMTRFARVEGGR
jgi:CubicO group peptidase (beta-lactamase class C family)